jgi:hypothetical protein
MKDKTGLGHRPIQTKLIGRRSSIGANLSPDLEASRERFATCRPHGNREGLTFHSGSIGRTESRPSWWRSLGCFFAYLSYLLRIARANPLRPALAQIELSARADDAAKRKAISDWMPDFVTGQIVAPKRKIKPTHDSSICRNKFSKVALGILEYAYLKSKRLT